MGRPKKAQPQPAEPEEISQEVPDDEVAITEFNAENADDEPAAGGTVSKAEAVRKALAAGMDKPEEGVNYVKKHFGIDLTRQMWSSYKTQQKARDAKKAGDQPATSPAPRKQAAPTAPAAPRQAAPAPKADATAAPAPSGIIGDIADIKRLLATHGKDGLEELINVLG